MSSQDITVKAFNMSINKNETKAMTERNFMWF